MAENIPNQVPNDIYADLVMTRYPKAYDERTDANNKINRNMLHWVNMKDYNMAEHVNALQDGIMALQRTLGELAQVPAKNVDGSGNTITDPVVLDNIARISTIKSRLDALELYDWFGILDKRYGGTTWLPDQKTTIQGHKHLGAASGIPGSPEKIDLKTEVTNKLPKLNIDLSKTVTGLTGADVFVQPDSDTKIADALNEKISEKTGGSITKAATLEVLGKTQTRWTREFDAEDATGTGNVKIPDAANTLTGYAMETGATAPSVLLRKNLTGMYHGRYVMIIRMAASALPNVPLVTVSAVNSTTNAKLASQTFTGAEFETAGKYKTFYLIFENNGATAIQVEKLATTSAAKVRFDYAIVEPVHPAVFDR